MVCVHVMRISIRNHLVHHKVDRFAIQQYFSSPLFLLHGRQRQDKLRFAFMLWGVCEKKLF